jgi:hypothetical protein
MQTCGEARIRMSRLYPLCVVVFGRRETTLKGGAMYSTLPTESQMRRRVLRYVLLICFAFMLLFAWREIPPTNNVFDWPTWARWLVTVLAAEVYCVSRRLVMQHDSGLRDLFEDENGTATGFPCEICKRRSQYWTECKGCVHLCRRSW